jgi:Tfp pilus assembly protein PilF
MRLLALPLLALAVAQPGWSETAPPPPGAEAKQAEMDALFAALAAAPTEAEGRVAEDRIWRRWIVGPDRAATDRLAEAMSRIRGYDFAGAIEILDPLIAEQPGWAEPWNQRAFARFLRDEPDLALDDLDRALELEPRHFGALSGKAIVLMGMGRMRLGQQALREAVALHPWLKERNMLLPVPQGDDI